eukprot:gene4874-3491_t
MTQSKFAIGLAKLKRMPLHWKVLFGTQFCIMMFLVKNRMDQIDQMGKAKEKLKVLADAREQQRAAAASVAANEGPEQSKAP